MTTTQTIMEALIPFKSADMQFLADLCNKHNLDIYDIVRNVREIYENNEFLDDDAAGINVLIREAYEELLRKIMVLVRDQLDTLEEDESLSNFGIKAKHLLQRVLHFLEIKGYDTIYTNCIDSGFNSDFLNNSGILEIKSSEEVLEWAENNIEKYDNEYFKNL
jgi:hypothetical protein